jgi:hypothetical protein
MGSPEQQEIERRLAEAVRMACLRAALEAHEDFGFPLTQAKDRGSGIP